MKRPPFACRNTLCRNLTITGAPAIHNSGTIDLTQNGTQTFASTGNVSLVATGAAFVGSGASQLVTAAQLGGAGSIANTMTVGAASGSTKVLVDDTNSGPGGQTGPGGIVLVHTTSNGGAAFTLDPNSDHAATLGGTTVLNKDLWFYSLFNNPTSTVLISAPNQAARQFLPWSPARRTSGTRPRRGRIVRPTCATAACRPSPATAASSRACG